MDKCTKRDCDCDKKGCKGCYWDSVKIDKNIDEFLDNMEEKEC